MTYQKPTKLPAAPPEDPELERIAESALELLIQWYPYYRSEHENLFRTAFRAVYDADFCRGSVCFSLRPSVRPIILTTSLLRQLHNCHGWDDLLDALTMEIEFWGGKPEKYDRTRLETCADALAPVSGSLRKMAGA